MDSLIINETYVWVIVQMGGYDGRILACMNKDAVQVNKNANKANIQSSSLKKFSQ